MPLCWVRFPGDHPYIGCFTVRTGRSKWRQSVGRDTVVSASADGEASNIRVYNTDMPNNPIGNRMGTKVSAVSRRRLTILANFLDDLPEEVFYLGSWIHGDTGFSSDLGVTSLRRDSKGFLGTVIPSEMLECGATACAFGWACAIPAFKKAGLRLGMSTAWPIFGGAIGYDAAALFFKLPPSKHDGVAEVLFSPDYYEENEHHDPKAVAARIRMYLENPEFVITPAPGYA